MFCKNCGKELPDSAKFCGSCGTPVTPAAPEPQESAAPVENAAPEAVPAAPAQTLERPVGEASTRTFQPEAPAAPAEEEIPAPVRKRRGKSGMVVIGVGAVAAIVVVVILFKLISGMTGGGSKRTPAYAYLNDDYELMYLSDLQEKTTAIEVSDDVDTGARVQFTADGKVMYFQDNKNTLYKVAVSDLKKDGRPERVSRDVTGFTVLKTGSVLYTKTGSNGNRELNCYTGADDFRITKDFDSRQLSEDEKTIYFTERDEDDGTLTLYKMALKKDAKPEELLDDATVIYTPFDSDVLVYGENEMDSGSSYSDDMDRNTLTVYSCKPGGEPAKLLDDLYYITGVKVDGGKVSFYYMVDEIEEYSLYDLVSDSKQSEDAATTAQDLVWPNWDEYYPISASVNDGTVLYWDNLENRHTVDNSEFEAFYGSSVGELLDSYFDAMDIAYYDAEARYNAAMDDYYARQNIWNEAKDRDIIREQLKNESYAQHSGSLYHYTGSDSSSPVATNIDLSNLYNMAEDGIFLYKKAAGITGSKLCDVSDLGYYGNVYDYLYSGISSDSDWYQNVGGTESVFDFDDEDAHINGIYVLNGKELVLDLFEDGDRRLDSYAVGKTALTFTSTILDDEFSGLSGGQDAKGNDVLYLFIDPDGEVGDFTRYSDGKLETLAPEVYGAIVLEDTDAVYVISDITRRGYLEISVMQGGKPVPIIDEWESSYGSIFFLDSKQILYIDSGDDLYLWNGKEERRIAKDVEYVWVNSEVNYTIYEA